MNNFLPSNQNVEFNMSQFLREFEQMKQALLQEEGVIDYGVDFPLLDSKDKPIKCHENLEALLNDKGIHIKYNEVSREQEFYGLRSKTPNRCITEIYSLCNKAGFKLSKGDVVDYTDLISEDFAYNPVYDYLSDACAKWDCKSRIKELCDTLITENGFSEELKFKFIKTWLVATARITTNKGDKNCEGLLVLQGGQGIGKTTWIKSIVPSELKEYFKDGVQLNVDNKDSIYEATCNWICELGELDGTLKREQASLKAFFTKSVDVQRRPYAVKEEKYPRKTSFFGTVNSKDFLQDETGDRRYWVIPIVEVDFEKLKKIDLQQLWGEVMRIVITEEDSWKLDRTFLEKLNESNSDFRVMSNVQLKIDASFDWKAPRSEWKLITASEVADRLNLKSTKGLRQAIEDLGGEYKRTNSARGYIMPPFKSMYNI